MGLFGLGLASLMAPLPGAIGNARPSAGVAAVTVPAGSEFARPKPDVEPVLPQDTPAPVTASAPRVPAPQAASAAPSHDTSLPAPTVIDAGAAEGPSLVVPAAETSMAAPARVTDPGALTPSATGLAAPGKDLPPVQP